MKEILINIQIKSLVGQIVYASQNRTNNNNNWYRIFCGISTPGEKIFQFSTTISMLHFTQMNVKDIGGGWDRHRPRSLIKCVVRAVVSSLLQLTMVVNINVKFGHNTVECGSVGPGFPLK